MALFSKLNKQCVNKLYTKLTSPVITNHFSFTRCLTSLNISGIYPPITTTFDEDGNITFEKIMYNLEKWKSIPLRGYVVMGSTGEFVSLTEDEKIQIVKCVAKANSKDKLIIVGTGCQCIHNLLFSYIVEVL
ncbi:4-hydroxy-2-oxoglutarate aldolase, mitochondrial-like [Stegodyphus dumicola]|uniref:4-hydroxy-2-oxoglutarate aldolase, mitochondrial-like n=1 Tax=Stegodyphus dumicola TaxID=202533 RepID=UPI0015ABCDC9|nr:4-hydroxy-2-oxoglutarate aldolase, mitochondrial-like [Stegodyphus dumicola]